MISIHALREEGDLSAISCAQSALYFYPRPPRGGRPDLQILQRFPGKFLSTPSARRATIRRATTPPPCPFLSTPSARRATARSIGFISSGCDFYPRPPRGGRRLSKSRIHVLHEFLSTPSARRATVTPGFKPAAQIKFLSTPSARRATAKTERKHPAFVSLYTSLHKLQRDACKPNRKITPLLAQTAGIPVRSVPENHVCCRFALAGHQKISTLSWANFGCSPTCSTLVW